MDQARKQRFTYFSKLNKQINFTVHSEINRIACLGQNIVSLQVWEISLKFYFLIDFKGGGKC